jgi:hypothetical protein
MGNEMTRPGKLFQELGKKIIFYQMQNHTPYLILIATMRTFNPTSLQMKHGK